LEQFDTVYSVSDLHIGGKENPMFDQGERLGAAFRQMAAEVGCLQPSPSINRPAGPRSRRVALVLNGDVVDFLACPSDQGEPGRYFLSDDQAIAELDRLFAPESGFSDVWWGLHDYIIRGGTLIVVLGNHDIELALPAVQAHFLLLLSNATTVPPSPHQWKIACVHVHFHMDGRGYRCKVGDRTIAFLHGNEADDDNEIDYEGLRKVICNRGVLGGPNLDLAPNRGTQLVIDVMNDIKSEFPFVDLLKPEFGAALPLAMAISDRRIPRIAKAVNALYLGDDPDADRGSESATDSATVPSVGHDAPATTDPAGLTNFWLAALDMRSTPATRDSTALVDEAIRLLDAGVTVEEIADAVADAELGIGDQARSLFDVAFRVVRGWKRSSLRQLVRLTSLGSASRVFEPSLPLEGDQKLDRLVRSKTDIVVAGHSHFAKFHPRWNGHGVFINTGTWAKIMRIREQELESEESFSRVLEAIKNKDASALEKTDVHPGYIVRLPTVAIIESRPRKNGSNRVIARLCKAVFSDKDSDRIVWVPLTSVLQPGWQAESESQNGEAWVLTRP